LRICPAQQGIIVAPWSHAAPHSKLTQALRNPAGVRMARTNLLSCSRLRKIENHSSPGFIETFQSALQDARSLTISRNMADEDNWSLRHISPVD
jgi:hypothetical protein